jgi:high-affinity nickel permease
MFIFPFIFTVTFALNYVINMLIMNDDYDFIFQKQNARLKKYNDLFGKK